MSFLVLIIIPMIVGLWAQAKITSSYNKWVQVPSRGRITGAEAAQAVMQTAGITNVSIEERRGHLIDHYDPSKKRLVLSSENFHGTSLAALGVAAHEAGHAIQDKMGYKPLNFRAALIPVTQIASQMLPIAIFGGFIFPFLGYKLIVLAVVAYIILTIFQLVTLPVEFDASKRAKKQLVGLGILEQDEMKGVNQTLDAAAFTYVAAFISSLGWLLYYIGLASNRD